MFAISKFASPATSCTLLPCHLLDQRTCGGRRPLLRASSAPSCPAGPAGILPRAGPAGPRDCASARSSPPGRPSAPPPCGWPSSGAWRTCWSRTSRRRRTCPPRTFNNYFASKYEAICALALDRSSRIGDALRERPASESLWDAIRNAVLTVYAPASTAPDPEGIAGIRLVTCSPVLRGRVPEGPGHDAVRAGGGHRRSHRHRGGGGTFFTRAFAGAVTAVVQAATERWLFTDPPVALAPDHRGRPARTGRRHARRPARARRPACAPENDAPCGGHRATGPGWRPRPPTGRPPHDAVPGRTPAA